MSTYWYIGTEIIKAYCYPLDYSNRSGVYTEANCQNKIIGYHVVVVVGYGTHNGLNYWVLYISIR